MTSDDSGTQWLRLASKSSLQVSKGEAQLVVKLGGHICPCTWNQVGVIIAILGEPH